MADVLEQFMLELTEDLINNKVQLPTLPEIALRVKRVLEDDRSTPAQITKMVSSDTGLCARLIRVANSSLYGGRAPVKNVHQSITRLGMTKVQNIVNSLVMEQIYHASAIKILRPHLQRLWRHSTQVAAIAMVLAQRYTNFSPDQSMLLGLIHDVGVLPILTKMENYPDLFNNQSILEGIIIDLHEDVGRTILESWHFPEELSNAVAEHDNLMKNNSPTKELSDVLKVANLLSYLNTNHRHMNTDMQAIPAFTKLGITPEMGIAAIQEAASEIQQTQQLLGLGK